MSAPTPPSFTELSPMGTLPTFDFSSIVSNLPSTPISAENLAVTLVALFSGGWFLQQGVSQERNLYFQARLFEEVMTYVSDRFVEPVDREDLYGSAIDGVLESLGKQDGVLQLVENADLGHDRQTRLGDGPHDINGRLRVA